MGRQQRMIDINRRRARHSKLGKLRKRYAAARNDSERQKVLAKVARVAPTITKERFLAPLQAPASSS
jgi:hypothetical protein